MYFFQKQEALASLLTKEHFFGKNKFKFF